MTYFYIDRCNCDKGKFICRIKEPSTLKLSLLLNDAVSIENVQRR
jgi:hypothetical protein